MTPVISRHIPTISELSDAASEKSLIDMPMAPVTQVPRATAQPMLQPGLLRAAPPPKPLHHFDEERAYIREEENYRRKRRRDVQQQGRS